jgi:3-oxoacyl-[acyl-carrier protein] reductase
MSRFKNKVALVTGSARGIGKVIALNLARQGADVVISDVMVEDGKNTVKEIQTLGRKCLFVQCDVSNSEDVNNLISKTVTEFGQIDVLVNNAGITKDTLMIRMKDEDWDNVININLKGSFLCTRAVAKVMMKKRSGSIVNISSVVGLMGNLGQVNYSASKAGLIGLTKSSAKELAPRGITVNAIAPGFIETEMTQKLTEQVRESYLKVIPLNDFGSPEDVANAVAFLASEEARYITGEVIRVDGGMRM